MSSFAQTALPNLTFTWEDLLGLLRDELQEYGSLLGLLSAQQQSILERRPESLLEINQTVQTQMEASQILQKRRQGFVSSLANSLLVLLRIPTYPNSFLIFPMLPNQCLKALLRKLII